MRMAARHLGRLVCDCFIEIFRSGTWWQPGVILLLAAVAAISVATTVGVPSAVYVLF